MPFTRWRSLATCELPGYSPYELSEMREKGTRIAKMARILLENKNK